jgi:hypothetical protein
MFVGDSIWLKYINGFYCLGYTLVHDVWDDIDETLVMIHGCGTWFLVEAYHE